MNPPRRFLVILRGLILKGNDFKTLAPQFAMMFAHGVSRFAFATSTPRPGGRPGVARPRQDLYNCLMAAQLSDLRAQAHGAKWRGKPVGSFGTAAVGRLLGGRGSLKHLYREQGVRFALGGIFVHWANSVMMVAGVAHGMIRSVVKRMSGSS